MRPALRLATEDDAGQIVEIYAPFCLETSVSFEVELPSEVEMRRRIAGTLGAFPWLVCEVADSVVGYAYAGKHRERAAYRWSADVSVYVRESCHRRGIGRALYTALLAILRLQGYYNAVAGVTLPNPASEGLHRAMGFVPVGTYPNIGYKRGRWHDVAWSQLAIREPALEPGPPLDLAAVLGTTAWDDAIALGGAYLAERTFADDSGCATGR